MTTKLPESFSIKASELHSKAPCSQDKAVEALLLAAEYLRQGKVPPSPLDIWIADAFEETGKTFPYRRAKCLTDALHITASNRRPAGDCLEIGMEVEGLIDNETTLTDAIHIISNKLNINEKTVRNYRKKYLEALEEYRKIQHEED